MIPLTQVRILNTAENVLDFTATSEITELGFLRGNLHLRHTKEDVWPPVLFETTTQQATLWILFRSEDGWVAAGVERIRPGQHDKPEGDNPVNFIMHWVEGRPFGAFNGHFFRPGESIGVMVVSGNSRLAGDFGVRERTKVVEVQVPPPGGQSWPPFLWVEGQPETQTSQDPHDADPTPAPPSPQGGEPSLQISVMGDVLKQLATMSATSDMTLLAVRGLAAQLFVMVKTPGPPIVDAKLFSAVDAKQDRILAELKALRKLVTPKPKKKAPK